MILCHRVPILTSGLTQKLTQVNWCERCAEKEQADRKTYKAK
jgi:hypothetical protein